MNTLFRIKAIVFKEVKQLSRDRLTFGMIVMIPLIQLLLFGYAINTDIRNINVGIVDQSQSQMGRLVTESVRASQVVNFKQSYLTAEEAQYAIQAGEIRAALILPKDINQRFEQGRELGQWLVDGSDSTVSATILSLLNMPFTPYDKLANHQVKSDSSSKTFEATVFYNPSRKSAVNIVPGLLGVILSMTMVLFTSIAIVREREQGNLELLITTPVTPMELMIAKIIPYIFVGLIQVVIVLGLGHILFKVPINGSLMQIFLGSLLFIAASLTLGLVISTIAKTQLQSMQLTMFILLPSILLSGFMFPYEGMPIAAQWISEALPATHYIRIIRGVVVRGAELTDMQYDAIWLAVFTVIGIIFSATRFKKSLD
ncbi:ABC transporter permease [Vibrio sp. Isolate34]|uniref:ABC transporter permease n=1 Tax=Vibrio sp. Isolate34 TaxID=2908540 RepID=UPI001EFE57B2|nr:ABC transporter permease [Vibrio sp. Isolate34]MCG9640552.1 ABC transporter permease [Vibrio sp. Isolate34]